MFVVTRRETLEIDGTNPQLWPFRHSQYPLWSVEKELSPRIGTLGPIGTLGDFIHRSRPTPLRSAFATVKTRSGSAQHATRTLNGPCLWTALLVAVEQRCGAVPLRKHGGMPGPALHPDVVDLKMEIGLDAAEALKAAARAGTGASTPNSWLHRPATRRDVC